MLIKVNAVDQSSGNMGALQFLACIQRDTSSCRLVQTTQVVDFIGDNALSTANIALEVNGASVSVQVAGIDGLNLDWCIQLQNDILTN
jgi:hypothetical protein